MTEAAWQAAQAAARTSYGRLLALLAWRWRDIAAAEDALADAFAAALLHWPRDGIPTAPDAWLMAAAKRKLLQAERHRRVTVDPAVTILLDAAEDTVPDAPAIPDARLRLLFVCAHPGIEAAMRTPLMLQTVLGLEARQIAAAFLVAPATMAQRLVRVKARIRDAGVRFELPEARELPGRVQAVLEAIYAAYGLAWDRVQVLDAAAHDLADEALFLATLAAQLLPQEPEAAGLLALLRFCEARQGARRGADGAFIPLHEQDTGAWNRMQIRQANETLWNAAAMRRPGPFQLEAAIQSAHCQRAYTGTVPWDGIATLYAQLVGIAPSLGAQVGHAVAVGESGAPQAGLDLLALLDARAVKDYPAYWVARAHLLGRCGQPQPARACYDTAIGLTTVPEVRTYLQAQRAALV
jgi:RNA polymerase sigma-70 factor (ECF subfamily)